VTQHVGIIPPGATKAIRGSSTAAWPPSIITLNQTTLTPPRPPPPPLPPSPTSAPAVVVNSNQVDSFLADVRSWQTLSRVPTAFLVQSYLVPDDISGPLVALLASAADAAAPPPSSASPSPSKTNGSADGDSRTPGAAQAAVAAVDKAVSEAGKRAWASLEGRTDAGPLQSEKFQPVIHPDDMQAAGLAAAAGEASGPGAKHGAATSPAATTPSRSGAHAAAGGAAAASQPLNAAAGAAKQQQQQQQSAELASMRGEMMRMAETMRALAAERDAARAQAAAGPGPGAPASTAEILGLRNKVNALVSDMTNVVSQRDALAKAVEKRETEIEVRFFWVLGEGGKPSSSHPLLTRTLLAPPPSSHLILSQNYRRELAELSGPPGAAGGGGAGLRQRKGGAGARPQQDGGEEDDDTTAKGGADARGFALWQVLVLALMALLLGRLSVGVI
jgi:hypothetical protein